MHFKIIYNQPGRLRVRAGHSQFDLEQSYCIEKYLLDEPGVTLAQANFYNGAILIEYNPDIYENLISKLARLDTRFLPEASRSADNEKRELNNDFYNSLVKIGARYYLFKWFVPMPIRLLFIFRRTFTYWKEAFGSLSKHQLDVAVLDASAISASLYMKDISGASQIMLFLSLADLLQDYTKKKASQTLADSLALNIDNVWQVKGLEESLTPITTINVNDRVKIRMGSVIPLDGQVIEGQASVNEASMTGEALPVLKSVGDSVYAGCVVEEGWIIIQVSSLAFNTRIQNIVEQIENSQELKAGLQTRAEALADSIVPLSFLASIGIFLTTRNLYKALSVLMVDYSCAIKLTTPISIISATRQATQSKAVVKGGVYLEKYSKANTIVFDKTGTLTSANPKVGKIIALNGYSEDDVLVLAACLEEHFSFSLANTIVKEADKRGLNHTCEMHGEVNYTVAHGISSSFDNERLLIGSKHFIFEDEQVNYSQAIDFIIKEKTQGYSNIYLAVGDHLAGIICIEDPVRVDAKAIIHQLKELGITRAIILTGDEEDVAKKIADEVGISEYYAKVSPEQKAELIEQIKADGNDVIMVGDGINDTLALSCASVSVAMSDGSELAKEVADITLKNDSLSGLVDLRLISQAAFDRINHNYAFIVGFNTFLLGLGVAGQLSSSMLALLHNSSTVAVGALSARSYYLPKQLSISNQTTV